MQARIFTIAGASRNFFSMSKKTVSVLMKMAEELHVTVEEPVVLSDGKNHRYKNAPSLYFMEQNLFRPYYHKWRQKEDELRIVSLKKSEGRASLCGA